MSRKITQEDFLERFTKRFPLAEVEIIDYHSLKKPCILRCKKCGTEHRKIRAEGFLSSWPCCNGHNETNVERIKRLCELNPNYQFIKKIDATHVIVKHLVCGNELTKTIQSAILNTCTCNICNTQSQKLRISIEDAQKQLNDTFGDNLTILFFDGVDSKKSKYRCNNCGLIFTQAHYNLISKCRGCPKCDQRHSKGERAMEKILENSHLNFKTQVRFPQELGRLSFDFGIYDDHNNLMALIEVQGDQHYREVFRYPSRPNCFKTQQAHDEEKRIWCRNKGIPLYEVYNDCGKLKNLDILPFISSTTISAKESTL